MDRRQFEQSLAATTPPPLGHILQALWYDAKGDWATAHEHAQAQDDAAGAWVHGYLHRKEGDLSNAAYWYRRAGQPVATGRSKPNGRPWWQRCSLEHNDNRYHPTTSDCRAARVTAS